jgi:hypothetical protein
MNITPSRSQKTPNIAAQQNTGAVSSPVVQTPIKIDVLEQPRVNQDGQTGQTGPIAPPVLVMEPSTPANAIEKSVLLALRAGYDGPVKAIADLKHLLMVSRMPQEFRDRVDVKIGVMETIAGGKPAIDKRIQELSHLMTVARFDQAGAAKANLELESLKKLSTAFAPLEKRLSAIDALTMRAMMTAEASMSLAAERGAIKAFVGGADAVATAMTSLEKQLSMGTPNKAAASLALSAMIGTRGGLDGLRERIASIQNTMMVSRFDAAGLASITMELNTMQAVEKALQTLEQRANSIAEPV